MLYNLIKQCDCGWKMTPFAAKCGLQQALFLPGYFLCHWDEGFTEKWKISVKHNCTETLNKVLNDLDRWTSLPSSLWACIAVIKNECLTKSKLHQLRDSPLSPAGYWSKLHSAVSRYIWNGKCPHLKSTTIQRRGSDRRLAVPNFILYYWSFVLRPLITWFDPHAVVHIGRKNGESLVFVRCFICKYSHIQCQLRFGPIIAQLFQVWDSAERLSNISCRWHQHSPVFNNKDLLIGGRPATSSQWESRGIHFLGDIYSADGLCSFQDIKNRFNLPGAWCTMPTTFAYASAIWVYGYKKRI